MAKVIGFDPVDLGYGGMVNYSGADNNKVLDDVKDGDYPAVNSDANWSNVISLMKFEDNYTDDKGLLTWTGTGTSFNASGKFGKAVEFNSTSDRLDSSTSSEWTWGTNDYTIEMWVYWNSTNSGTYRNLFFTKAGGTEYLQYYIDNGNNFYGYNVTGGPLHSFGQATDIFPYQTWFHLALTRQSNGIKCFVNGAQKGTTGTMTANVNATEGLVGRHPFLARGWPGSIDSLRVTKNVARYTGNFTAPTADFLP